MSHIFQVQLQRLYRYIYFINGNSQRNNQENKRQPEYKSRRQVEADVNGEHTHYTQQQTSYTGDLHGTRQIKSFAKILYLSRGNFGMTFKILVFQRTNQIGIR